MTQMTLRQIPDTVSEKLRAVAKARGESVNRTAIRLLSIALGVEKGPAKKRDLGGLAGNWTRSEADDFDQRMLALEKIDEEVWR